MRASAIAESFGIDKGAISRQVQHLSTSAWSTAARPRRRPGQLLAASDDAVRRMEDVADHRRKWLDEQLGDWTDGELTDFVDTLARYNEALNQ